MITTGDPSADQQKQGLHGQVKRVIRTAIL
jgi:hypothetical protein